MITQERLRELLNYDPDTGIFTWIKSRCGTAMAGSVAGYLMNKGYRHIGIDGRYYQAHRLAWLYTHGKWPAALIDHINGDRADNRIANLREATKSQNGQNCGKRRDNTSGYKGVSWDRGVRKWHAKIKVSSTKRIFLGCFDCPEEASRAYEAAAERLHGEFANTGKAS